ncbi:apolipoprotein N-acyltransferase [soil metagenome]
MRLPFVPAVGTKARTRLVHLGAALLGGALSLIFPEAGLWWWAYVGLVPILVLVVRAPARREAGWRAWWAAFGFYLGLHHWLLPTLGPLALPIAAALGVLWLPFGLAAWSLLRRPSWAGLGAALVVLPAVWVVVEQLRSWEAFAGSWGLLGLSQWQVPAVLSVAALGGVWLVSWMLVTVNVAVAAAVGPGRSGVQRTMAGGVAVVLVAAAALYGSTRPDPPVDRILRIGGVQPGAIDGPGERLVANEDLTRDLADHDVDLVVWGQSSVGFDPEVDAEVADRLTAVAKGIGVDVLVNVDARGTEDRIQKSARLITAEGQGEPVYDKQRLVPFGEYIPGRAVLGWIGDVTEAASEDRLPGDELVLIDTAGVSVGPLISYESTFPDLRRAVSRLGAELVVVQGASTTFQGSWALPQQASFEAVRAVESGRPAVLVQVSGTSSAFDPRGRQLVWVDQDEQRAFVVDVPVGQEETFYVRHGDWVLQTSWLVVIVAGGWWATDAVRRRLQGGAGRSAGP